jgi:outer membrane receptor protein involved in Fe transport
MSMQELPQSIQAFTAEDIKRNAFTGFNDVANALPSLTLIQDTPGRNSVKFRGASTGTGEYYTASTAAVYLDETPLTFNSQQLWPAMVDIERIESLPGPQGTLFGSSSLAGTVRVITNKPDPTAWSGEVYSEYYATKGGSGSWAVNGHINIPLIKDTLALRLVAHTRDEGGWIDNIYGETYVAPDPTRFSSPPNNEQWVQDDWNKYKLTGGRASLLWNMTENWSTTLMLISERNAADGSWAEDTYFGDDQIAMFHDEFRDDDWWNASLMVEGDLGFATLVSSTTYLDRDIAYEWENMVYEQWKDSYWGAYYPLYNSAYTYGWVFNDQTQDRFSQEIRLTSQGDSRFQWMIGGFYEKIEDQWLYGTRNPDLTRADQPGEVWYYANYWAYYYNYYGYDVQYPLPETDIGYSEALDRTYEQLAFFGEVTYDITEAWSVTGGARWFRFSEDMQQTYNFPGGLPVWGTFDTNGTVYADSTTEDWAFKLSTQFDITDNIMVYALFSQGFRPGGQNSFRAAQSGLLPPNYGPDFMDNYEIGTKSLLFDGSLQLNVTLFHMEWDDRQFAQVGSGDLPWWLRGTVNAGKTTTDGVELSFLWQATNNLQFEGNVTWLDAQADSTFEFLNGNVMRPGDPLPNAPEWAWWVAADYTLPWRPFDGTLWTRVDYAYGDEWWDSTSGAIERDPADLIPDWSNVNLQLGLSLPNNWTITAFVNNLTDEKRVTTRLTGTESDWFGVPYYKTWEYQVRPRSYGLSVRKAFR